MGEGSKGGRKEEYVVERRREQAEGLSPVREKKRDGGRESEVLGNSREQKTFSA